MEVTDLNKAIDEEDWDETRRVLDEYPHVTAEEHIFTEEAFDVLWWDAPIDVVCTLLKIYPQGLEGKDCWNNMIWWR